MIQLYSFAFQDRSDRVRWLMEELQVPYENNMLDRSKNELKSESYLKLNPMGRVPTLIDQDTVIYESVGICLYLADKYKKISLAPDVNSPERAAYLQWMVFSVGSLECVVAKMFTFKDKSEAEINLIKSEVKTQCEILKLALNSVLEKQPYLLKSGFSAADIMMAAVIPGAAEYLMTPGSAIEKYMKNLMARPAAIKVHVFE